jgi:succinoglycan biosynthesis protein ExoM
MIDVTICICTFRRPDGLRRLLRSLRALDICTPSYDVIVADNDASAAGRPVVDQARREGMNVQYVVEPVRGIARARNRSIAPATGEFVAFIDDDEEADPWWLANLYREVNYAGADAGIGAVIPAFGDGTPRWLIEGGFYDRQRPPTGTVLRAKETRTGNALVRRALLERLAGPFDERYNFSGGEDGDMFSRLIGAGARVVAVDSAIVYEHVPYARTRLSWLLQRRFLAGMGAARLDYAGTSAVERRLQSGRVLASAIGWGLVGLLAYPADRGYGFDRLSFSARLLGRFGFLNGLSWHPYLRDSWR